MRPGRPPAQESDGLFKTPLDRFIDMGHPLVRLADRIDWEGLETQVASCFAETGRPATPARFALGMLMLKAMHDLCDEALWERWPCDPYFQYFTGELYFQHKVPHERSGLSHWRGRLGPEVLDELIRESLRVAHATGALSGRDMAAVSVNTTVQEKAARFPTDAGLLYQALVRVGKRAQIKAGRYAHAKQFNRRNRMIRVLRTRLGRVIRDIERKIAGDDELAARFADSLAKARAIRDQVLVRRATTGGAQDLFLARPRSRVHQQGQGAGSLRVRLQGDHHHHQRTGQGRQFVLHAAALQAIPSMATRSAGCSPRPPSSPASRRSASMSTRAIAATARTVPCSTPRPGATSGHPGGSTSPGAAGSRPRSKPSFAAAPPSNPSSAT